MTSKSTLQKAAEENIISPEQVEPLYQFIQDQKSNTLVVNKDEPIKFIRSFGDVFITFGVILLVLAINKLNLTAYEYLMPVIGFVVLAEWLVRIRRLALPGIAILISILWFVFQATPEDNNISLLGFFIFIFTSLVFYLRYKMPFSLLPLAGGIVAVIISQIGFDVLENPVVFAGFGIVIFIVAFWFDSQDIQRISHLSDNAFWLYLLASPLIVHGAMISLLFSDGNSLIQNLNVEFVMMLFFVFFFLLSLLIDRRVMLISTQLYLIYALTQLMTNNVNNTEDAVIYIFVGLGLFVIFFGTFWYKTRRFIFGCLSESFIRHYIPDLNTQDVKNKSQ